jgi:hypothetical protein
MSISQLPGNQEGGYHEKYALRYNILISGPDIDLDFRGKSSPYSAFRRLSGAHTEA